MREKMATFFLKSAAAATGLFLIFAQALPLSASADAPLEDRLEAVSVTGSRVPLQLGQSARIVTVMDSVILSSLPALTINDVLKYAVGVDVRQRGVEGMQTDISLRGGTCDQIAVLLDGVNISDPQTGHNAADFPVDISLIDRIEVLEGPASRVYGASSLVGAINVVTRRAVKPSDDTEASSKSRGFSGDVTAHIDGGSYMTFSGGAGTAMAHGDWHNALSVSYSRSDGYTRNAEGGLNGDFQAVKAFYRGGYKQLWWQAGLSNKDFGSNTFYSARFDDQFEHTFKTFAAIGADTEGFVHFSPVIYWNHSQDRFELFRGKPERYPYNHHRTHVYGARLGAWFETVAGRTAFGAEIRNEDIVSTNLGEPLERPEEPYKVGLNRTHLSYWLEHNLTLSWMTASAGLTAARNMASEEKFGIYPGVDLSFRIGSNWKIYASYNASYRVPTFTELYYSVGGHKADKQLRPEKMHAVEGGVKCLYPGIRAIASVWYHLGRDMIDWIKTTPEADWTSVNHTRINALGQEVTVDVNFPQLLGWRLLQSVNLSYCHIGQNKDLADGVQSAYALEYLRHKLVARVQLNIWSSLFLDLSVRWQDREGRYERYEAGSATGTFVPYQPCTFLDAQLSWNADCWRVFAQGTNLLNQQRYDHGNIPLPGIWLRLGASYTFRWKK